MILIKRCWGSFFLANFLAFSAPPFPTCCIPPHSLLAFICSQSPSSDHSCPKAFACCLLFSHTWCCFTSLLLVSKERYWMLSLASKNCGDPQRFNTTEGMELVSQPCHWWVSLWVRCYHCCESVGDLPTVFNWTMAETLQHWKWMGETRNLSAYVLKRSLARRIP